MPLIGLFFKKGDIVYYKLHKLDKLTRFCHFLYYRFFKIRRKVKGFVFYYLIFVHNLLQLIVFKYKLSPPFD